MKLAETIAGLVGAYRATAIDVGARWGAAEAWWRVRPLLNVIGFEPDADECARLNALIPAEAHERYVPRAVGSAAGPATLHVTAQPACSSLFRPIEALAARYPGLECIRVERTIALELSTLDAWASTENVSDVRFLKIDTQGAELDILRGAERMLEGAVGLEVEVEFAPIYEGQPLFADVDTFLRARGFRLWRLGDLCHYAEGYSRMSTRTEAANYAGYERRTDAGSGRLFWANAVYFRDYAELPVTEANAPRLLVLASLLEARGDALGAAACVAHVVSGGCPGLPPNAPSVLGPLAQRLGRGPMRALAKRVLRRLRR